MYLTAQLVQASREGKTGINVALYDHASERVPDSVWEGEPGVVLKRIAEQYPGLRLREHIEVLPGGNAVECFLDIASRQTTDESAIAAALDALRLESRLRSRAAVHVGDVWAAFCTFIGDDDRVGSLNVLATAALELFRGRERAVTEAPLRVLLSHDEERWRYVLDEASANRVRAAGGEPVAVTMRFDVADDFRTLNGPLYPSVAQWVTNLSTEQLMELGGVEIVHAGKLVGAVLVGRKTR